MLEHRQVRLPDGEVLVRILLDAEQSEAGLDLLEKRYAGGGQPGGDSACRTDIAARRAGAGRRTENPRGGSAERSCTRTSRCRRCSRVYLAMAVLSTIVATVGLYYNSVGIIIGAMVIAPLLGGHGVRARHETAV